MPDVYGSSPEFTVDLCRSKCWQVHICCEACRREVVWRSDKLAGLPQALTLGALANSAKCECGHVGAIVSTRQDHGATQAADAARNAATDLARR